MLPTKASLPLLLLSTVVLAAHAGQKKDGIGQGAQAPSNASASPATAASAMNTFGLRLLSDVSHGRRKNVFISPLSVFFALSMAESGADGGTRTAMRKAMAIPATVDEDQLQQSSLALLNSLESQKGVRFLIANALWSDARLPLAPSFVDRCHHYYQAEANTLDLAGPGAANTINGWVKAKTQDKIPTIVTPEALRGALAVLTNAVYFKGAWQYKFTKSETQEGDFHLFAEAAGGSSGTRKVHFMHRDAIPNGYRSGPDYEAAALPYAASNMVLYAILPAPGKTPQEALERVSLQSLRTASEHVDVDLKLPRFTLDFADGLKSPLETMGMSPAFHQGADFKPMGSPEFFIRDVLHKTHLEIDEEGTVAAAATATTMTLSAMPPPKPKKVLVFDRPFALLLTDAQTGAILFAGVIYDPQ